jgi:replicative DNA helicase
MDDFFNNEIETAVLGLLLTNGYAIYDVKRKLKPHRFSSKSHELIYRAMDSVADTTEPNYLLVKSKLIESGTLEQVGGYEYLEALTQHHEDIKSLNEFVRQLNDAYKARRLLTINANIPTYLQNASMVNEVVSKLAKELSDLVMDADQPDVVLIGDVIDETYERILKKAENPGIDGTSTGFTAIDHMTGGFLGGEIWYIGARPSHGKSTWLIKTAMNVAKQGSPVLIFNREMSPDSIQQRMLSIISGIPLEDIRRGDIKKGQAVEKLDAAREALKDVPIYLDSNFQGEIDYIVSTIRKYHQLYKIKVVGLDYIGLIVERTAGESTHLLGAASRQLKLLSNELNITTIILSQMNRACETRENRRPLMADLRQSGNLEEDADIMVALYRDEVYTPNSPDIGKCEFIIRKARNGPIGTVRLNFDGETVNLLNEDLTDLWKDKKGFI